MSCRSEASGGGSKKSEHGAPRGLNRGDAFFAASARAESVTAEAAASLLQDLCKAYRDKTFQKALADILRSSDPQVPVYGKKMSDLLSSAYDKVFPQHGLPRGREGDILLVLISSLHKKDPKVKALVQEIDMLLYRRETSVQMSHCLTKTEVLDIARSQIAVFSKKSFQDQVASLADSHEDEDELAHAVRQLQLVKLEPILSQYDLPPSAHGVRELLSHTARHIMDPSVATCLFVINTLLGMNKSKNVELVDGLRSLVACRSADLGREEMRNAEHADAVVTKIASRLTGVRLQSFMATL